MTPIITFTTGCGGARIERLETRPAGCMAAMAEIPRNRRRWVLPAALVVVGVLMMVIGSFRRGDYASAVWLQLGSLALFGPLYGPADAGAEITERVPRLFVMRHRRAGV
jgi:drug/metabolite transporter (DMT)-like permease